MASSGSRKWRGGGSAEGRSDLPGSWLVLVDLYGPMI